MTNPETPEPIDNLMIGDLFRPLIAYRRLIWQGTIAASVIALLLGGLYLTFQATAWSATLGFRPVFDGVGQGRYPNGVPFAASDITATSAVAQVLAQNNVRTYCTDEAFRAGLVVQEGSAALQFLTAEFEARLSDTRLGPVDRQRIQDEFSARRTAMPIEYQLVFIRPAECAAVPQAVVLKVMSEVLEAWAVESQERRGVLNARVAVLSTEVFTVPATADMSPLVKADLVRTAVARVIANISEMESLPGIELVRAGENRVALAEVRLRLQDLMQARLDPVIAMAGRWSGRESVQWVVQSLDGASAQLRAAQARADAYRQALREYSGVPTTPATSSAVSGGRTQAPSDVQALTPQIDRTFIEGIVALSAANTQFRQEITRRVIEASMDAASRGEVVEHYRWLLASMKDPSTESLSLAEVNRRLDGITADAKETTRLFNEIFNEYSRVAFRAGSAMYQVEQPTQITALRAFSFRRYFVVVGGVFLASPVVLAALCLVLFHLRRFIKSALPA